MRTFAFAMLVLGGLSACAADAPRVEICLTPGDAVALKRLPERVAAVHRKNPAAVADVLFSEGDYTVPVGGLSFANTKGPIVLRAEPNAKVRLFGSASVDNWTRTNFNGRSVWTADASHVPFKARPSLFFCGGRTMIMARTPDFDPSNPYAGGWRYAVGKRIGMYREVPGETKTVLKIKDEDWRDLADFTEGRVFTFPRYNWQSSVSPVTNAVVADRSLHVSQPFFFASRPGDRYYLAGYREDLTSPGEWYFDWTARRAYFIPPEGMDDPNGLPCGSALSHPVFAFYNVCDVTIKGLELLDDGSGDAVVSGNIVERSTTAMHLHCHRYGTITNNLFISNGPEKQFNMSGWLAESNGVFMLEYQPRDLKTYRRVVGANPALTNFASLAVEPSGCDAALPDGCVMRGNLIRGNIFYYPDRPKSQAARVRYFNAEHNTFSRNVYWAGTNAVTYGMSWDKTLSLNAWRKLGEDVDSVVADPLIADPSHGDFTLAPDSPALRLGFVQIPFREIGLRPSAWRTRLPVAEAEGVREHPEWLVRKPVARIGFKTDTHVQRDKASCALVKKAFELFRINRIRVAK